MEKTKAYSCKCGCGETLLCQTSSDMLSISILSSCFYTYQKNDKIAMTIKALRKKPLTDIVLKREQIEELIEFIASTANELEPTQKAFGQESDIILMHWFDDEIALQIKARLPKSKLLIGKIYRAFDICYNKDEAAQLAQSLKKQLEECKPES